MYSMLIKHSIVPLIKNVDMTLEGQIWIELMCFPEVKFGGVYILPEDSIYYDRSYFGTLNSMIVDNKYVMVMGDFNARVAEPPISDEMRNLRSYEQVKDVIVNNHGQIMRDICKSGSMVIANHLVYRDTRLGGNLSFKKKDRWISEIDLCLLKTDVLNVIKN